ncbi:MAG: ABC transporter permease [Acholeplasmataceae bacterium]
MFRYIITRLILMVITLFIVVSVMFIATRVAMYHQFSSPGPFGQFFEPVCEEYFAYIEAVFTRFDWGSDFRGTPVWDTVTAKAPLTIKLNLIAFAVYMTFGIGFGILSAVKKNSLFDRLFGSITLVIGSIPSFIMIFALIIYVGYRFELLPPIYPIGASELGFFRLIHAVAIPLIALSLEPLAKMTRLVRSELLESFDSDYVLLLTTKGLNQRQVIFRHHIKHSAVSVVPEIAPTFMYVLFGSFFIEMVFNMQGLANLFFDSLFRPFMSSYYVDIDIETTILISVFYAVFGMIATLLMDTFYVLLDPRIKIGSKKASLEG